MTDVLGPIACDRRRRCRGLRRPHRGSRRARAWSSTTRATTSTTRTTSGARSSAASTTTSRPGLPAQLDFSATPRYQKGGLFTWTVYDYPLKQAIIDSVVKQPDEGHHGGPRRSPVRRRQRQVPGLPDGRGRALAGVSRPAQAARQEAGALRHAQQHRRSRRRRRLPAGQVPDGVRSNRRRGSSSSWSSTPTAAARSPRRTSMPLGRSPDGSTRARALSTPSSAC